MTATDEVAVVIGAMAKAGYERWNANLSQPPWDQTSQMTRHKWITLAEAMLRAAQGSRRATP